MARILVAEDERSLAEFIRVTLEDDGHELTVVGDGAQAIEAFERDGPFDLLVLDLMMPKVDGFEVLASLGRARPPVVVLTARDDPSARTRAEGLGVEAFVPKPYDPWELSTTVQKVLAR